MLMLEGDVNGEEPFMVLLGGGGCRLLVVRETFEETDSVSAVA